MTSTSNDNKNELTLSIGTPKGSFSATFPKTTKVIDVINAAIATMKLDGGADAFELFLGDESLVPVERPLVSFDITTGAKLLLTATGSGV